MDAGRKAGLNAKFVKSHRSGAVSNAAALRSGKKRKMPRKNGMKLMMEFVRGMERVDVELAECFAFYVAEEGFDKTRNLTDKQHKSLIRRQYDEFLSAMEDGLF